MKFTMASQRRPELDSYSDADIQRMYDTADNCRKVLVLRMDNGEDVESLIDDVDKTLFILDDELCARGM